MTVSDNPPGPGSARDQTGRGLRVEPVRTRRELRDFLHLPVWDERSPTHAVPLWHSTIRRWWSGKGPHRAHGPVELHLARDEAGTVRGRMTLHTDERMDHRLGEPTLLLGAVEFADRAALAALVGHAEAEARSRGRTRLLGPVSLLPNQVGGVITSGFDQPGFLDGPWNPEHVPADWEALGFERIWTGATWRCEDVSALDPDEVFPVGALPKGVVLRHGSRRHLGEQLPVLRQMLNAAFAELGYYTQIEADELEAATDGLAHLLDERLLLWLERPGQEPERLAFVLVVPDLTDFVRSTGGRLSVVDMVRLMATRSRYRQDAVLIIKGTVPGARGQGLMRHLSHALLSGLREGGYRNLSVTFIEDDNAGSQAQFVAMGGRPLHGTCFYTRAVEPSPSLDLTAARDAATAWSPAHQVLSRSADWGRAPSAHNTQPWRVRALDDRMLAVGWHGDRELPVADPHRRDLLLSLGTLVLSLRVVAEDLGLTASVRWQVDETAREAAVISLAPPPLATERRVWRSGRPPGVASGGGGEMRDRIPLPWSVTELHSRATVRSPYVAHPSAADVDALAAEAGLADREAAGSTHQAGLVVLPDDLVDEWLPRASARTLTGPAAEELSTWLRLSPTHPRHDLDGLSAQALGLSSFEARGLGLLAGSRALRRVLSRTGLDRAVARTSLATPRGAVVALCAAPGASLEQIGALGEQLLAVWLAGERAGWSAHPLSELIDDPRSAAALDGWASTAAGAPCRVYAVWRWGRPVSPGPRSPRLTDRVG